MLPTCAGLCIRHGHIYSNVHAVNLQYADADMQTAAALVVQFGSCVQYCMCRYFDFGKGAIGPPLQKDHLYKKTTLQKDHLFQTEIYMKKGFQDEKLVPVVA